MEGVSPTAALLGPKMGWPLPQWGHREGERGHLGLFPRLTARSEERFVKNHPDGTGGTREGAPGEARGPHTTKTMVRDNGGAREPGGGRELFPPEPTGFSVTYARGSGGKSPNNALFSVF